MKPQRLLFLLVLSLPACSVYESWPGSSRGDEPPAPVQRVPPQSESPPGTLDSGPDDSPMGTASVPTQVARPTGPAGFLLDGAHRQRESGDLAGAAQSIERAMRIQPGNPWLSLELGQVRLAQGNATQAELMARRALAQASGDPSLRTAGWTLTAQARELRGDRVGAAEARAMAGQ
ncbi:MAG: tetratricopeptide repeat protein [Pseudomonadota bacterium]